MHVPLLLCTCPSESTLLIFDIYKSNIWQFAQKPLLGYFKLTILSLLYGKKPMLAVVAVQMVYI